MDQTARAKRKTLAFWRSFAMFEALDDPTLALLADQAGLHHWTAGAVLFQRGDPGDYLIALSKGRVRLSLGSMQGRELTLRHAGPGDLLGELALFDQSPRSADGVAMQDSEGYVLHRSGLMAVAAVAPGLWPGIARSLCARLRDTTDQMEGIALYALEARLARFLLFSLRQIHGDDLPGHASLRLDLPQGDIATLLGASRPKVNRALLTLHEAGAAVRQDAVLVCDISGLQALAEPDAP